VFAHDNGIVVLPQHKTVFCNVFKNILVCSDVEIGVGAVVLDTKHRLLFFA